MTYLYLAVAGLVSGVLGGMGMGGGTLLIPLLTIIFGFNQKVAQGINLISFSIMAIVILVVHIKNKLINIRVALFFSGFAIISSILGAFLASVVKASVLKVFYGWLLIAIAVCQAFVRLKQKW